MGMLALTIRDVDTNDDMDRDVDVDIRGQRRGCGDTWTKT